MQAAINSAQSYITPRELPSPPIYSKSNPRRRPHSDSGGDVDRLFLSLKVEDYADTRLGSEDFSASGSWPCYDQRRAKARGSNPGQSHRARLLRHQPGRASRDRLQQASVNLAKGNFDGPQQAYEINANDQLLSSSQDYRSLAHCISERRARPFSPMSPTVIDDVENELDLPHG